MVAALAVLALAACGNESKKSSAESATLEAATTAAAAPATDAPAATEAAPAAEAAADFAPAATDAPAAEPAAEDQAAAPGGEAGGSGLAPGSVNAGRRIIYTGTVRLETPNVEDAVSRITELVANAGGAVASSELDYAGELPRATLTVKLPPNDIGRIITRLAEFGDVIGGHQDAEDVTGQLVDLDARILGAIASVDRARVFFEQATNVQELAELERQLTERETTLEQLRAQQKSIADRVASATLTIELTTPPPPPEVTTTTQPVVETTVPDGMTQLQQGSVGSAFGKGWRAFMKLVKFFVVLLAVLAPFLAVIAAVVAPIVWLQRRKRRRNSRSSGPTWPQTPTNGHPSPAPPDAQPPVSAGVGGRDETPGS